MMSDMLLPLYPWIKSLHVISFVAWMAGLFYLPRLFVYHAEASENARVTDTLLEIMELKLLRVIMTPAMFATWTFGLLLIAAGAVDWSAIWPYTKAIGVIGMTWFHMWCARQRRLLASGASDREGSFYRKMNEVPTVLLVLIVVSVVARPF